jgi:hypothetical protein
VVVKRAKLGGNWDNSSSCSSQSVNCNNSSANVNANYGGRGACDTERAIPSAEPQSILAEKYCIEKHTTGV